MLGRCGFLSGARIGRRRRFFRLRYVSGLQCLRDR